VVEKRQETSLQIMRDKMKVITDKKNELEIEITGETHTLCNALRKALMEDNDVEAAAYVIEHPIIGEPKLYIKAKNPKKSLKKAAETLKSRCDEFKELIESDGDGKTTGKKKAKKSTKKAAKKTTKKTTKKKK
jgi:DNA-directed RNA polymerase subunit L